MSNPIQITTINPPSTSPTLSYTISPSTLPSSSSSSSSSSLSSLPSPSRLSRLSPGIIEIPKASGFFSPVSVEDEEYSPWSFSEENKSDDPPPWFWQRKA